MNTLTRKAGSALLLALALAPGLSAGNHPSTRSRKQVSRTSTVTALILGAAAVAAATDPATGAGQALATAGTGSITPAPGVSLPVASLPKGLNTPLPCTNPHLVPSGDLDPVAIEERVDAAVKGYGAAGCDFTIAERMAEVGPEAWVVSCKVKKMSASEYGRARYAAAPYKYADPEAPDEDGRFDLAIPCESFGMDLDKMVCWALKEFRENDTQGRHAELLEHLLHADYLHRSLKDARTQAKALQKVGARRLQETTQEAPRRQREARERLAKVEGKLQLKLKLALAKERAAQRENRVPQEIQARQEAIRAQYALEDAREAVREADGAVPLAQWDLESNKVYLTKGNHAAGRFREYAAPLLKALASETSPGMLVYPPPMEETVSNDD